jgi:hypothetical protein
MLLVQTFGGIVVNEQHCLWVPGESHNTCRSPQYHWISRHGNGEIQYKPEDSDLPSTIHNIAARIRSHNSSNNNQGKAALAKKN